MLLAAIGMVTYLDELGDEDELIKVAPVLSPPQPEQAVYEQDAEQGGADDDEPLAHELQPDRCVRQVEVVVDDIAVVVELEIFGVLHSLLENQVLFSHVCLSQALLPLA